MIGTLTLAGILAGMSFGVQLLGNDITDEQKLARPVICISYRSVR